MPEDDQDLQDLLNRIATYKADLQDIGIVLRGSVIGRHMPCGKKGCRCQADPPVLHGPYYQWTRKVGGKTKTVRLKPAEAEIYRQWIDSRRRLDDLIARWEAIGLEAAELIRRKRPR